MERFLPGPAATEALGRELARVLAGRSPVPALLLSGPLGAGKTTLVRALVEALPGAEGAEVASPSFNILNLYPTTPPVAHFDLYRLEGLPPGEEFLELAGDGTTLLVVEWSEHLPPDLVPDPALTLRLTPRGTGRAAKIEAVQDTARAALTALNQALTQDASSPDAP
ncbi:MAG: tRNA (adenosine(37)-N6)-threonylcarbamoyltransferase complex ATPase subunit type 1 TsaE [Desulfovibrionaceae bacterium]